MSSGTVSNATARMDARGKVNPGLTAQLSEESRRMEERLRMLREMMQAEKASRGADGGIRWQSGAKGPLSSSGSAEGRKQPHPPSDASPVKKSSKVKRLVKVRLLTGNEGGPCQASPCGQCSKATASLHCVECTESYCTVCFAKFHQRGALTRHHARPLIGKHSKTSSKSSTRSDTSKNTCNPSVQSDHIEVTRPIQDSNPSAVSTTESTTGSSLGTAPAPPTPTHRTGSLLEGHYDEESNTAAFREALEEWRAGGQKKSQGTSVCRTKESSSATCTVMGTQTAPLAPPSSADGTQLPSSATTPNMTAFGQTSNVSYLERMMVRRNRTDPLFLLHVSTGVATPRELTETAKAGNHNSPLTDPAHPSQYNLFYGSSSSEATSDDLHHVCSDSTTESLTTAEPTNIDHYSLEPFPRPKSSVLIEVVEFPTSEAANSATEMPSLVDSDVDRTPQTMQAARNGARSRDKTLTNQKPKSRRVKSSKRATTATPLPNRSRSGATTNAESDAGHSSVASSIRRVWSKCLDEPRTISASAEGGRGDGLSTFFLSGVVPAPLTDGSPVAALSPAHSKKVVGVAGGRYRFAATVWLPGSSICAKTRANQDSSDDTLAPSETPTVEASVVHSPSCSVDVQASSPNHHQPRHHQPRLEEADDRSTPNMHSDSIGAGSYAGKSSEAQYRADLVDSDSEDTARLELGGEGGRGWKEEGERGWEKEEEEEEDCEALEGLGWELASITSGRTTRCDLAEEEEENEWVGEKWLPDELPPSRLGPAYPPAHWGQALLQVGVAEGDELGASPGLAEEDLQANLERMMREFELEQQCAMEQSSD